jgi:hypothetical protein
LPSIVTSTEPTEAVPLPVAAVAGAAFTTRTAAASTTAICLFIPLMISANCVPHDLAGP